MLRCCVLALTRGSSGKYFLILPQQELQPMPNMCSPVHFLHSPRCFNPGHALRPVTQAFEARARASRTRERTCRLLWLSERTCFQWKPESSLPKGPRCGSYFLRWGRKKTGSVSELVVHRFSSKGGKANIKQKRVKTPAALGRDPAG